MNDQSRIDTRERTAAPADAVTAAIGAARANDSSTRLRSLPDLRAACREVDDRPDFAGRLKETTEERILAKLDGYERWLADNDLFPPRANIGNVSPSRVLAAIGHAGAKATQAISVRIQLLGEAEGFRDAAYRHDPERPIDRAIDAYAVAMRDRKKGPPRSGRNPLLLSKPAIAADMPCAVGDLDQIVMKRLRRLAKRLEPGDIAMEDPADKPAAKQGRVSNPAVDLLLAAELDRCTAKRDDGTRPGLPADVLEPDRVDMLTLARNSGVAAGDLLDFPERLERIEAARRVAGLRPHPVLALRTYTYAELIAHGEAERLAKPGKTKDAEGAVRKTTFALRGFMRLPGVQASDSDQVPLDFRARVQTAIAGKHDVCDGFASQMNRWIEWNQELRDSRPLPDDFGVALRVLAREAGRTWASLALELKSYRTIRAWFVQGLIPSVSSDSLLARLAKLMHRDEDALGKLLAEDRRSRNFDLEALDLEKGRSRFLPADFASDKYTPAQRAEMIDRVERENIMQDTDFARRQSDMVPYVRVLPRELRKARKSPLYSVAGETRLDGNLVFTFRFRPDDLGAVSTNAPAARQSASANMRPAPNSILTAAGSSADPAGRDACQTPQSSIRNALQTSSRAPKHDRRNADVGWRAPASGRANRALHPQADHGTPTSAVRTRQAEEDLP